MHHFWPGLMHDAWADIRVPGQPGKETGNLKCYIYVVGYITRLVSLTIVGMNNETLIFATLQKS